MVYNNHKIYGGGEKKRPQIFNNECRKFIFLFQIRTDNNRYNNNYFGTGMACTTNKKK